MIKERLTEEKDMYNFKLPEDIHGYRLPQTIDDIKRHKYFLVSYTAEKFYSTMTDEEASELLKKYNPRGLFRGFSGNNPNPITLGNCVRRWFIIKMEEAGVAQRIFREKLGRLDVVVDPNDIKIISRIYDPHADQHLIDSIRKKELDYCTKKTYELKLKLDELKEEFDAEAREVKEEVIPAGTVIKTNINVPDMIKLIIQQREQQLNRAFGL